MADVNSITCIDPNITLDQLLSGALVKRDSDGLTGIRTVIISAAHSDVLGCAYPSDNPNNILRQAFVMHNGKPAICLFQEV